MNERNACVFTKLQIGISLSFALLAESSRDPVDDCTKGAVLSSTLRVGSYAYASSSCSEHMTSVFLYAYNSTTGESGRSNSNWTPTEAWESVSESVTLSIPATYASSDHGAWCESSGDTEGYVNVELTSSGVPRSVGN